MHNYLDFEKPISDLEGKILELKKLAAEDESIDTSDEIARLEVRVREATLDIYSKLNPWQKTQVARHPQRPHFVDYLTFAFTTSAGLGPSEAMPLAVLAKLLVCLQVSLSLVILLVLAARAIGLIT